MADKESFEAQQQSQLKPPMFPTLTSGKANVAQMPSAESQNENSIGGYYRNVTQKSRLILPTAIWILIVVAGLCFLSLLSSLNKTINTLDTLIEIEQENAKLTREQHDTLPDPSNYQSFAERLHIPFPWRGDETKKRAQLESKPSWFSFPSWTSLEPQRNDREEVSTAAEPLDFMSKLFGGDKLTDDELIPMRGGIIIATDGNNGDNPDDPDIMHANNPFGSMLRQILPALGGADSEKMGDFESNELEAPNGKAKSFDNEEEREKPVGSIITANIDKINININPAQTDKKHNKKSHKKEEEREKQTDHNEEINSLDKSIDSLVSKLMDSNANGPSTSDEGFFVPMPLPVPPSPFLVQSDSDRPVNRLQPQHMRPAHHHHHHHSRPHSTKNQQDNLVDELKAPSLAPFIFPFDALNPLQPQPHSLLDSAIPPMFGRPHSSKVLISLEDIGQPDALDTFDGAHKKNSKQTIQPAINSPYELLATEPTTEPKDRFGSKELREILANSLAQSLFPIAKENELTGDKSDSKKDDTIILYDGEPIKKLPTPPADSEDIVKHDRNQMKDIFNIFFGPPPNSKLVVAPEVVSEPEFILPGVENTSEKILEATKENKAPDDDATLDASKVEKMITTVTPGAPDELLAATPVIVGSSVTDGDPKSVENLVSDLMSGMFALPQMANEKAPMQVEAQHQGGDKGLNTTGSRESMVCDCHKVASNSSSLVSSSGSSSAPRPSYPGSAAPGGPGQNAQSSGGGGGGGGSSNNSSSHSSSPGGGGSSSGSGSGQSTNSSSVSRGSGSSPSSSGGSGASNGSSSGSSGGSSSSGSSSSSNATRGSTSSQSGNQNQMNPIGYVSMPNNNRGPTPSAFAADNVGFDPRMQTAGQQSGSTPARQLGSQPPNMGRPGSMLSLINNSTGGFIPRFMNRLNSTDVPCDGSNSTRPFPQQISNFLQASGLNMTSSSRTMSNSSSLQQQRAQQRAPISPSRTSKSTTEASIKTPKSQKKASPSADAEIVVIEEQPKSIELQASVQGQVQPSGEVAAVNLVQQPIPSKDQTVITNHLVNVEPVVSNVEPSPISEPPTTNPTSVQPQPNPTMASQSLSSSPTNATLMITTGTDTPASKGSNDAQTVTSPRPPFKTFLQKADDFIERNIFNFKRFLD